MADQEIAKHTKQIWNIMSNSGHGGWHKLREMLLEMIIIVFAVSLSIWLHGLGEHRHEQQQVKTFLVGLKHDIEIDIKQVKFINDFYHSADANFQYLSRLDPARPPEPKKFEAGYAAAMSNVSFIPQMSRYEGFKSSGKLSNIENDLLLERILRLYQSSLPRIRVSEGGWTRQHDKLREYLDPEFDMPGGAARRYALVSTPLGSKLISRAMASPQLYERYADFAALGAQIIGDIDAAYPEQAGAPH